MKLRYHLDENVPNAIANGLRLRGLDVTTSKDAGLLAATDDEQIEWAKQQHRAIFTTDDDFLRLASAGTEHAGIVCPLKTRFTGVLTSHFAKTKTAYEIAPPRTIWPRLKRFGLSLLKQQNDKHSIAMRRRIADWNINYLAQVLGIPTV